MEHAMQLILLGGLLMLMSILAGQLSNRLGAPVLLTFLGVGIFFGVDGPGGIAYDDTHNAFLICSAALAIILFDGGLRTPMPAFKMAFRPALMLSTVGVLITAFATAFFAVWFTGVDTLHGFLLGSIIASTDAAAVFLLLHQRGVHIPARVSATLEVESGINDPMAVFLTMACVTLLTASTQPSWMSIAGVFIHEMGLGIVVGYAGGIALSQLLKQVKLDAGLYPVVTLLGGLIIFSGAAVVGGSGFLAAYIGGMTFANNAFSKMMLIKHFNDGMAWIAQLVMLLTLGLLVTPSNMVEYIVPAVMIAVFLMMVARPLAVWVCLIGQNFTTQEKTFVSWVGLRGAIPIYLALIPALSGIENGHYYFNVAFIIVISSLLLQGWTINLLATKLGLSKTGAHKH